MAAQRWRDRQNGRGPARPAGPVAPRSCRPSQGSRGGRVAELATVQAAGRIKSEAGGLLATPARVNRVLAWTRLQAPRVRMGRGRVQSYETHHDWRRHGQCMWQVGGGGVRTGGETAVRHRPDRARSRAGTDPDSRGGNGTNPQPRISSKADWADRIHSGDQMRAWRRPYDQPDRDAGRIPRAPL